MVIDELGNDDEPMMSFGVPWSLAFRAAIWAAASGDAAELGPAVVADVGAAVGDGDAALLQAATAMIETNPTATSRLMGVVVPRDSIEPSSRMRGCAIQPGPLIPAAAGMYTKVPASRNLIVAWSVRHLVGGEAIVDEHGPEASALSLTRT